MVCRAGAGMNFNLTPIGRGHGYTLDIRYRKADRGFEVDPAGLQPGECTWLDREIRRDEPSMARFWMIYVGEQEGRQPDGRPNAHIFDTRFRRGAGSRPITVSFGQNGDAFQLSVLEPNTSSTSRPFKYLERMEFTEGQFFTLRAKEGDAVPRKNYGWNTKVPVFVAKWIRTGGIVSNGTELRLNARDQVYVAQNGTIRLQTDE